MIRVLLADDAVVVRRLLSEALSSDPDIQVVGTAADGRIALAKIPQTNPDIVILDIEMPEMDGLETLKELRKQYPKLPVIMFSTLAQRGAAATLDALALGANDYVTKPTNVGGVAGALQHIRAEMIPKIKAFCERRPVSGPAFSLLPRPTDYRRSPEKARAKFDVLAIGASTGGPNALTELFSVLPADLPVPIVIVQHMPPLFTRLLAERLSSQGKIKVVEASPGYVLLPGCAFVAPGDFHMEIERQGVAVQTRLNQGPPENSCRPAVDVLFRSVAEVYGPGVLAVVLTGMGQDGLRGCERIRAAGGSIIVQDEATSVVWGMPGFVARAGLAEQVLPLPMIGAEVVRRLSRNRGTSLTGGSL